MFGVGPNVGGWCDSFSTAELLIQRSTKFALALSSLALDSPVVHIKYQTQHAVTNPTRSNKTLRLTYFNGVDSRNQPRQNAASVDGPCGQIFPNADHLYAGLKH